MNDDEFGRARKVLWNELVALTDLWAQYLYLYGGPQERVEVMNACAPWFFGLVQRTFINQVLLSISRLTDPPLQSGHRNLTIHMLIADSKLDQHPLLRVDLSDAITRLEVSVSAIRTHRRKSIAHMDRATALDDADVLLPGVSRGQVDETVRALTAIYNQHSMGTTSSFNHFDLNPRGGSDALLTILEQSKRWESYAARQRSRRERDEA